VQFVEIATGQVGHTIGHKMKSKTSDIQAVKAPHPITREPVVFVDTPGFDDTYKSDTDIVMMVANWLIQTYQQNANLARIVYLHRITDNRMSGSLMKSLLLFTSLCGQKEMPNVVIVTTMWSEVKQSRGEEREEELKRVFWAEMIRQGCRVERFQDTAESAWGIIGNLDKEQIPAENSLRAQEVKQRSMELRANLHQSAVKDDRKRKSIIGRIRSFFGAR